MANTWDPGKEGIKPSYTNSLAEFDPAERSSKTAAKNASSTDLLRNSENSALSKNEPTYNRSGSSWRNNVNGRTPNQGKGKNKGKFSGKKKGIATMTIIMGLITGGVAFLGSSHALLFAGTSYHATTGILNASSWPINNERRLNFLDDIGDASRSSKAFSSITGIPKWLKTRFSTNDNFSVNGDSVSWHGTSVDGNFSRMYKTDSSFRNDFDSTAYGRVISLQDNTNVEMLNSKFGITGNAYRNYKQTNDADADMSNYRKTAGDMFEGKTNTTLSTGYEEEVEDIDEDGNHTGQYHLEDRQNNSTTRATNHSVDAETIKAATDYVQGITQKVGKVVNYSCTVLRAATMVATAISGVATYNYARDAISNYLEPMSKTMAGDGSESPINAVLNRMTTPYTTKVDDLTDLHVTGSTGDSTDCYDNCNTEGSLSMSGINSADDVPTKEYSGAFTEDKNFVAMMTQQPYNKHEAAVNSFNRSLQALITSLKAFNITNAGCALLQGLAATTELATTVVGIGVSLLPGGQVVAAGGVVWQGIKNLFAKLGIGIVLNFAVSSFMAFLVPQLAKTLFSTPDQDADGIPGAERFVQALNIIGGQASRRNNGGSLATTEEALAYSKLNQEVIAREAEVDRMNRSPFDITSPNTFLGSIANSLLPVVFTNGVSPAQTIINSTSTAIANITNSASADGENSTYLNTFGDCSYLKDTYGEDIAADIYCNPIILNDTSTLETSIDDPRYSQVIDNALECDSDGKNCSVKSDSNLARYISYCSDRSSPFGVVDANILSELETGSVVLNALPIVGNVVDILNSSNYAKYEDWASGRMCYSKTNPDWENEYKYYQLYILDMHIAEQIGAFEDSEETGNINPITAYREKYAAEHPQDDSFAGYVARVSGITKADAEGIIAVAQYYLYLQDYDPSTRIALEDITVKTGKEIVADYATDKIILKNIKHMPAQTISSINHQYIIYNDVRNRSFAV